ncbi:hypothetical protein DQ04_09041030 [Trypanosoma grayi]|uniref:hypothetical protein n=1 Tax=Trypanosoma grayi TaxID=71804 RepID=UPI0004F49602|nr:hypothetical protein DQ04_09041030 [Trypanosoma grayi]KEG07705.1 hypothetical protein DQ04_09041030 [Trypanosoma grayi]
MSDETTLTADVEAAAAPEDVAASKTCGETTRRNDEEAEARESYMQIFGEVRGVLFPTLVSAKTAAAAPDSASSCFCVVCELPVEPDEILLCSCGSSVHSDCADTAADGVLYCSRFCHVP